MEENYVITVGRQFGSRGKEVGQALASRLGIAFYDKELITLASKESGLCQEFFEKADEKNSGSLLQAFAAGFTFGSFQYNDILSNDKLFQIQSEVIRKIAEKSSCVIVGRCADYVLRDYDRVVNVFLCGDEESKIRRMMRMFSLEREAAIERIHETDKQRRKYYNYYTGKDWEDAKNYDLCLNSSQLGYDTCVELIERAM